MVVFELLPMGKPRMTQRDKWAQRDVVLRYYTFKDELRRQAREQGYTVQVPLKINFYLPMPPSWSKKKRERLADTPHEQKPDADNLVKAFLDALLEDDSKIWDIHVRKFWGGKAHIVIDN